MFDNSYINSLSVTELTQLAENLDIEEIMEIIGRQFEVVKKRHGKFAESGTVLAEKQARNSLRVITVLSGIYRKKSVAITRNLSKKMKKG